MTGYSIRLPRHLTADPEDHVWVVAGLAEYVDTVPPVEGLVGMGYGSVVRNAVVLACHCGRSRWVKTRPVEVEEAPQALPDGPSAPVAA